MVNGITPRKVTVIVPVYGDWPSLKVCIESLEQHVDTSLHKVMFVNDSGPEADLMEANILGAISSAKGFSYFRNDKNLGFGGTCNKAVMDLDKTNNDILLLNSDTRVTSSFLEEMIEVLHASPSNGSVSPRSNNATIATIPLSSAGQKGIGEHKSYTMYKRMKKYFPASYEVPVAHGFCMLIRRSLINKYGLFDKAFGKGYGEEVDFCMRIAKHGYKSLLANHAFVFHLEARSFSLERKALLLERNHKIIMDRYPDYGQNIHTYVSAALKQEECIKLRAGVLSIGQRTKLLLKRGSRSVRRRLMG